MSSQPGAEVVLEGPGPWELAPGFLALPTPGHTKGHCVLLFQDRFLFTGDHLDWDRDERQLSASQDYCWYSWPQQAESMGRLADYRFEWVLPGHGQRVHLPATEMRQQVERRTQPRSGEFQVLRGIPGHFPLPCPARTCRIILDRPGQENERDRTVGNSSAGGIVGFGKGVRHDQQERTNAAG